MRWVTGLFGAVKWQANQTTWKQKHETLDCPVLRRRAELAWLLIPKYHVSWPGVYDLCLCNLLYLLCHLLPWGFFRDSFGHSQNKKFYGCNGCLAKLQVVLERFGTSVTHWGCNPRFQHTFVDEDQMMVLKGCAPRILLLVFVFCGCQLSSPWIIEVGQNVLIPNRNWPPKVVGFMESCAWQGCDT